MTYLRNLLIAIDQLANALIGGSCDETLSARAERQRLFIRHVINAIFFDRNHCFDSYHAERLRTQLPEEYRHV